MSFIDSQQLSPINSIQSHSSLLQQVADEVNMLKQPTRAMLNMIEIINNQKSKIVKSPTKKVIQLSTKKKVNFQIKRTPRLARSQRQNQFQTEVVRQFKES